MIDALYHWSPSTRYESIRQYGLKPGSESVVASDRLHYLCVGVDPARAWTLSGGIEWCAEIEQWDLWSFRPNSTDELYVRPFFGRQIEEIKLRNPVSAERLWWVGRRDVTGVP